MGINWGTAYNKVYGGNEEERVEDALASAAKQWIRQGYRIWMHPVWGPDLQACKRLAAKIGNADQVRIEERVLSWNGIKRTTAKD